MPVSLAGSAWFYYYMDIMRPIRESIYRILRWSERYTRTDMVYLFESGFWLQASSVFITLSSFALYVIFGHVLPKDVYGNYQYLLSLGAIAAAFTMTGMNTAVIRSVARGFEGTFLASLRIQLIWGIIPLLGCWVLGAYYLVVGNPTLGWGLVLMGIFIPFNSTFNTFGAYLSGKKDFKRTFFYYLIVNAPYYVAVALVAISIQSALTLLAANLISQALGYWVAHRRTVSVYKPQGAADPDATRYATHLSILNFLGVVMSQLDNILVFHFLGATELALYSFATAMPTRLGILKNIANAAFPKYAEKSNEDMRTSILRKLTLGLLVLAVMALLYFFLAPVLFNLFFPRYVDAVPYSQVYVFVILTAFSTLFTTMLTAQGHVRRLYIYNILSPLIILCSQLVGILGWGLWGLIYAVLFSNLLTSCLSAALALW